MIYLVMVPTVYLKRLVQIIMLISKYNEVFYGRDEPYFVCTHSASASDRHRNQAYLPGTGTMP